MHMSCCIWSCPVIWAHLRMSCCTNAYVLSTFFQKSSCVLLQNCICPVANQQCRTLFEWLMSDCFVIDRQVVFVKRTHLVNVLVIVVSAQLCMSCCVHACVLLQKFICTFCRICMSCYKIAYVLLQIWICPVETQTTYVLLRKCSCPVSVLFMSCLSEAYVLLQHMKMSCCKYASVLFLHSVCPVTNTNMSCFENANVLLLHWTCPVESQNIANTLIFAATS